MSGHSSFDGCAFSHYRCIASKSLFPSGPWTGFYNYGPGDRHRMDLHLTFANGNVSGDGNDDIGRFLIRGHCDAPGDFRMPFYSL